MAIPANLRRQVVTRAANCCEYCAWLRLSIPSTCLVAGGQSTAENLAMLASHVRCEKALAWLRSVRTQARRLYYLIRAETHGCCISAGTACEWWVSHRQDAQRSWRYT